MNVRFLEFGLGMTAREFLMRVMLAIAVVLFVAAFTRAGEPPVAQVAVTDPLDACVKVQMAVANSAGQKFAGSGVCIASENGQSIVLTNNHIFSDQSHPQGGFRDDIYPVAAEVLAGQRTYKAVAVGADRPADVAVLVVEGTLPHVALADTVPPVGSTVWRNGSGSGFQKGVVAAPDARYTSPSMQFWVDGKSDSGDSGSAYFNDKNECVALHAGRTGDAVRSYARGTPVTSVKVVVRDHVPRLFPRLRAQLGSNPPPAVMVNPKSPATPPVVPLPPPAKKTEAPFAKTVVAGAGVGISMSLPGAVCTGPSCGTTSYTTTTVTTRRGLFGFRR